MDRILLAARTELLIVVCVVSLPPKLSSREKRRTGTTRAALCARITDECGSVREFKRCDGR